MSFNWKNDSRRIFLVVLAAFVMAMNINTFVTAGGLYPGGVSGLTILIQRISLNYFHMKLPYSLVNIALNAAPVYVGFRFVGKKFTLYSLVMILCCSFFTDSLPVYEITQDTLLIAIFGGIINGLSISLSLFADATSGGTDFLAIYLSDKKGIESWNLVLGFNAVILGIAGYFFGWDKALYSIIFQYASTQTLYALYRNYQKQTLFIVTDHPQEIAKGIHEVCNHGASIMKAEGSYEHKEHGMVYSVVSSTDAKRVRMKIKEIDPKAFVNMIRSKEIFGRFVMKPRD